MTEKFRAGDVVTWDGIEYVLRVPKDSTTAIMLYDSIGRTAEVTTSNGQDNGVFQNAVGTSKLRLVRAATDEERRERLRRTACGVVPLVSRGARELAQQQWLDERTLGDPTHRYAGPNNPFRPYPSPAFANEAGKIQNVVEGTFSGCAVIASKRGAVRSNHWHRTDSHHLHLLSGRCLYWELDARATESTLLYEPPGKPWFCSEGDTIYTGPERLHAIAYLEDTTMISCSSLPRDHESHERDLVRVPGWVGREVLAEVAPWIEWLV